MSHHGIQRRVLATLGLALFVLSTNAYAGVRRERPTAGFFKKIVKAAHALVQICDTLKPPTGGSGGGGGGG